MNSRLDRRRLLTLAGMAGLAATLPACGRGFGGNGNGGDGKVELNMVWWGDAQRAEQTSAALDLFQSANPGIRVRTEYQDSSPYKDKLAARFAAGDPPDLMAMRFDSLREYADRGTLLDLAKHSELDQSGLTEPARALGQVGAASFGVPSGLNTIGFVIDKTLTGQYGVDVPNGDTWSWDDLATFAQKISKASGNKVYGTNFEPWTVANLLVFARQRGEDFFTADGKLGATEATLTAWYQLVEDLRKSGAIPPAGFIDQNNGASAAQSYLAKKSIASQIIPTNNLISYNKACGGNLELLRMPGETQGARRGQSVDTPALWSIASASKHPAETVRLLNFLTNDTEAAKVAGATRGVPASSRVAETIASGLEPDNKRSSDFLGALQKEKLPASYPYPVGASKLTNILKTISTEVEFGRTSPADAGKQFITEARKAIAP
ncbi:ABC transporter substrate-binding protein [Actinoplanes sp. NPDC026670]|uniref:ABC transporter substrate-binding protein n=1 Tax=Actinoplanes sp. NPDC026670 TaxID=3154700 RepID=UPI003411828C